MLKILLVQQTSTKPKPWKHEFFLTKITQQQEAVEQIFRGELAKIL